MMNGCKFNHTIKILCKRKEAEMLLNLATRLNREQLALVQIAQEGARKAHIVGT
jgi:hypothetical protein